MNLYSVSYIAQLHGIAARRVRWHCKRLLFPIVGANYVLTDAMVTELLHSIASAKPGPRPRDTAGK